MKKFLSLSLALVLTLALTACGGGAKEDTTLKVAASSVPHAEILAQCVDAMAEKGYTLQVTEYGDYVVPNTAVEEGEEDANYFQHVPYLDSFNATVFRVCAYYFSHYDYFDFPQIYRKVEACQLLEFLEKTVTEARCSLSIIYPKEDPHESQ